LMRGKYLLTFVSVVLLIFVTGALNALLTKYLLDDVRNFILDKVFDIHLDYSRPVIYSSFYLSLLAGLRGGLTIAGIAAAIKITKHWYVKNQRNLQLQQENTEAQLQLLKAQVHPHFLFNTLNNIYSFSQNTAPTAAKLVTGLSDMLRYMIYEGNQSLVPLSKEVKMLQDYISLQQIRYEDLEVHTDLPANTENLYIAPLLLLPLIENCFKHGTSNMLEHPWVSLHITIEGKEFTMKLVNGKAENYANPSRESGIGISNVKKRLEFLYPGKHNFKTIDSEDVFIVDLKLELEKGQPSERTSKQTAVHA
jgi:LytS/YehU family sensor histidine kinase